MLDIEKMLWLEDSKKGRFSRYAVDSEDSIWICNECDAGDADPYEDGCSCCNAKADQLD